MSVGGVLHDIVSRIGAGEVYSGGNAAVVPGPGHSKRDRSLSLRLVYEGGASRVLYYSHAGDSGRDICQYLGIEARHDQNPSPADRDRWRREREKREREQAAADLALCRSIWDATLPIEGTPAETYLFNRGLVLEGCSVVRFHPAAPRSKRQPGDDPPPPPPHQAMVVLVHGPDDKPRALHVTFITNDGRKAFGDRSRVMFGPTAQCAARLEPPRNGRLAIAEGIETAASYSVLKGVSTWSGLSTSIMQGFQVPAGITDLVIAADGDDAGMKAAQELALRAKRRCNVEIDPAPAGKDWNTVLMESPVV